MTTIPPLTFGVELEVLLSSSQSALVAFLAANGLPTREYHSRVAGEWYVKGDISVRDHTSRGRTGGELVSPILRGEEGLAQARLAGELLTRYGADVNTSCGFHVHVGLQDLGSRSDAWLPVMKNSVLLYGKYEPVINGVLSPSRRENNSFALNIGVQRPDFYEATTVSALQWAYYRGFRWATSRWTGRRSVMPYEPPYHARFRKVNLIAPSRHGTIEFRQHQGTTDPIKIDRWIRFILALSQKAREMPVPNAPAEVRAAIRTARVNAGISTGRVRANDGQFRMSDRIELRRRYNPRRYGSQPYAGWQALLDAEPEHRTVALALRSGLTRGNLRYDSDRGYMVIGTPVPVEPAPVLDPVPAPVPEPVPVPPPMPAPIITLSAMCIEFNLHQEVTQYLTERTAHFAGGGED